MVTSYILTAVLIQLGMLNLQDTSISSVVSPDVWMEDDSTRQSILLTLASSVVESHTDLATKFRMPSSSQPEPRTTGTVYDYSCELVGLGLRFLDFKDAL